MKKLGLLSLLLMAVLLTGCLAPKVNFTIEPNPIIVTSDMDKLEEITLKVKLSGFSFAYTVEDAVVELFDDEDELVFEDSQEINKRIPVVSGFGDDIDLPAISLAKLFENIDPNYTEAIYEAELKDKVYELRITLTGKNPTSSTVNVEFH